MPRGRMGGAPLRASLLLCVLAAVALLVGCGGETPAGDAGSTGAASAGNGVAGSGETTAASAGAVPAFAGIAEAGRLAEDWRPDARLYAVASLGPVDADGRSSGWLYSYVSRRAGKVVGVAVSGGEARRQPEQSLPAANIRDIERNALPPAGRLLDSTGAMAAEEAEGVRNALRENPSAESAAGLDSFSGGGPAWILSAVGPGGERIENRVPAVEGE